MIKFCLLAILRFKEDKLMANVFEILMLICFGFSWPINFRKAVKSKTTKGISLAFLFLISIGYIFGISAKILNDSINYVIIFYGINLFFVMANIGIYFINRRHENIKSNIKRGNYNGIN